jgi:hypothetical protein
MRVDLPAAKMMAATRELTFPLIDAIEVYAFSPPSKTKLIQSRGHASVQMSPQKIYREHFCISHSKKAAAKNPLWIPHSDRFSSRFLLPYIPL